MRIVFGFSRPRKWKPYAALIMWWDEIHCSHAYTKFVSESWETSFIYHSAGVRTNFMSQEYFDKENICVEEYEVDCSKEVFDKIGKICVKREGVPYPIKQTFGKALVAIIYLLTTKKISNPLADSGAQDCIEEQADILREGLSIETTLDMSSVSVKPYRDWIASLPQLRRIK